MKKFKTKIITVILALLCIFLLAACGSEAYEYPYIKIITSRWIEDNTKIMIGKEYMFKDFEKKDTENGCSVTIDFVSNKQKESFEEITPTKKENESETVMPESQYKKLNVEPILQLPELPTGCEITSLTTVLNYYGYNVEKTQLVDEYLECGKIGSTNPEDKFVGSPYDKNSYGCYSGVIANTAKSFSDKNGYNFKIHNLYGLSLEDLYKYVDGGNPVIIWSTIDLKEIYTNATWNIDGKEVSWRANEHCMVLIGYDKEKDICIVSDPLYGIKEYPKELFNQRYEEMDKRAVVIEKVFNMGG